MRIPFPERIPIGHVAVFVSLLFILQWLDGTALYFSIGCVAFILIAALAFNAAGGMTRASGAYVFFYSVLVVIVGITYKTYLWEPAQSNLLDPKTDIEVYVAGIAAMYGAVIASRRFSRKSGLLQNVLKDRAMYRASIGCMVFGVVGGSAIGLLGESAARLGSAFTQLNLLMPVGIIIGVMYEIRRSGGTRSLNLPTVLAGAYFFFFFGVMGFSKQGMLTPVVCWLLPVAAYRYRLTALQVMSTFAGVCIVFYVLVPFAQYGRGQVNAGQSFDQKLAVAVRLLEHPDETRKEFRETAEFAGTYYNTPQGFWDRLQFIYADDGLVNVTDQGRVFGVSPIAISILNTIPHFIWPNKPPTNFGNRYMHEVTGIPLDQATDIGISYSATAEAYHMAKWMGVLVVAPLVWFALFFVFDSLFGDIRTTPWGLLVLTQIAHIAPEGMLSGAIGLMTFGTEAFVFCAFFAAWAAPFFASAVLGPDRSPSRSLSLHPPSASRSLR